jgi:hypothetical protein
MADVVAYNAVDLAVTELLAKAQTDRIAARIALAKEYDSRDMINAYDAKLAELVLKDRLFGTGRATYPQTDSWTLYGSQIAEKFAYRTPALQEVLDRLPETMPFEKVVRPNGEKTIDCSNKFIDKVKVGEVTYSLGFGGIHSEDEPGLFVADKAFTFLDLDVDSFYPALILNHRLVPAHLPEEFLAEFDILRQKRLAAKDAGRAALADGLKIAINSVFGKSKSAYSWLCDPTVAIRTTLIGQFTLLWFVDALTDVEGVEVISANTDGLTIKVRRDRVDWVKREMTRAAAQVDLTLSWSEYRLIARRDVNNYLAVPVTGDKVKEKGAYGYDRKDLKKKAVNRIVVDAIRAYFVNQTPVADTIRGCRDVREFINYFKATKGWTIVDEAGTDHGKIARWYVSTSGVKLLKQKLETGGLTQLEGAAAVLLPDLPAVFPSDMNFDHYIAKAETLIKAITEPEIKHRNTIQLADLGRAQRDLFEANKVAEADPARCAGLDLERYHRDWANVIHGTRHDTMLRLMCRLWVAQRGALTRGDLAWACDQLDEAEGVLPASERRGIVDWIVSHISPFPTPQTVEEHVARAMAWAVEKITPNKRKRKLEHSDVFQSDFVKGDALWRYKRAGDVFRFACSLCSINVKHSAGLSESDVCGIITQVDEFLLEDILA